MTTQGPAEAQTMQENLSVGNTPQHPIEVSLTGGGSWTWQHGPVREVGVNGVQADEVLERVAEYLRAVNVPPFNSRETSLAITDIESAQNWLRRRTTNREARGVEGTNQV